MPIERTLCGRAVVAIVLSLAVSTTLWAQPRTDVVTLPNGDRITGEVVRLDRGRLEFKTDDAGTLYLEWDKLATVVATRLVEVVTSDGRTVSRQPRIRGRPVDHRRHTRGHRIRS